MSFRSSGQARALRLKILAALLQLTCVTAVNLTPDRSRLPQQPGTAQEIQPAAWSALGIDAVVVGQVTPAPDGGYNVAYQLVDTGGAPGTVLAQNTYKVNKQWLRYAGHTASDEVFEKLTGIKGAFRTRIAYVVQTNGGQFPYELRVSDYDGYNQFTVHRSPQPLMSPAWSPDGSKLAYVTFESGRSALVIQTLSNGAVRQVASFPRHNGAPAFSRMVPNWRLPCLKPVA